MLSFSSSSPGQQQVLGDLQQVGEAAYGLHAGPGQPRGLQGPASGQPRQVHEANHTCGASPAHRLILCIIHPIKTGMWLKF